MYNIEKIIILIERFNKNDKSTVVIKTPLHFEETFCSKTLKNRSSKFTKS